MGKRFWRDASSRLTFDFPFVESTDYPNICRDIADAFALTAVSEIVVGPDQMFWDFGHNDQVIELDWDNWMRFMVVAKNPESESLVREIATWLSSNRRWGGTLGQEVNGTEQADSVITRYSMLLTPPIPPLENPSPFGRMPCMNVPASPPLYLFPGLAADGGIFTLQKLAFPGLVVPPWLAPKNGETLGEYARRFADELKIPPGAILGGSSFGGILALEVARSVRPAAVVLIGSLHEPAAFPYRWGVFRPVKPVCRFLPVRMLQWAAYPATTAMARRRLPRVATLMRQFRQAEPRLFRWSVEQLLAWREPPEITCPIYRIHGDRDWVLPLPRGAGRDGVDIVEGGGHILSVSHPGRVNAMLRQVIEAVIANTAKGPPSSTSVTAAEADGSP